MDSDIIFSQTEKYSLLELVDSRRHEYELRLIDNSLSSGERDAVERLRDFWISVYFKLEDLL